MPRIMAPAFKPPPLSCDAHCHIFGPVDRYPYAAARPYTPQEAPLPAFKALHDRIGVERAVIVNATPYGRDNTVILDAIAQSGGRYRGIANVDDRMTGAELERLASGGIDGCRFTFLSRLGGRPDMSAFDRIVTRIVPLGWHVDLYLEAADLDDMAPRLEALPVPYVIDHMGVIDASAGLQQPGFQRLLALVRRDEKCWVKITGPERISRIGPPFHDAVAYARALIETAPDRVLWGTDWPHPNVPYMPDDGDLIDLVPLYAPDERHRQLLLVDNPARLFRFPI
ncbi:MAG: 2-pyrone-4,6-dicarboxylate hydrolase [Acidobacteria bacterium]|nr:MAG: 2-pyrone-4,6-dicarboxylate hydrolase [Acidobacteriota bacterium]